jgi:hypothetical protein
MHLEPPNCTLVDKAIFVASLVKYSLLSKLKDFIEIALVDWSLDFLGYWIELSVYGSSPRFKARRDGCGFSK